MRSIDGSSIRDGKKRRGKQKRLDYIPSSWPRASPRMKNGRRRPAGRREQDKRKEGKPNQQEKWRKKIDGRWWQRERALFFYTVRGTLIFLKKKLKKERRSLNSRTTCPRANGQRTRRPSVSSRASAVLHNPNNTYLRCTRRLNHRGRPVPCSAIGPRG